MALYQNGILISGANKLPQMTYAAWQALPAAERPSEWICTDRSYSDLPASDVTYDNTDSGLEATNVQDAIDEVAQSGGGGSGHTIIDPSGQSMSQEDNLQFTDAGVEDDDTNNKTKISIVREMTKAEYDALSETERKGIIRITDEPDIVMGDVEDDKVEVMADGTKTYRQLLNDLFALIDSDKITNDSKLVYNNRVIYSLSEKYSTGYRFGVIAEMDNSAFQLQYAYVTSTSSMLINCSNTTITNVSNSTPTSGAKFTFYYGTQSAPIELTTDAEHCMMSSGESVEDVLAIRFKYISVFNIKTSATITKNVPELAGKTIAFVSPNPLYINTSALDCTSAYSSNDQQITITKPNATFGGDGAEFKVLVGYLG